MSGVTRRRYQTHSDNAAGMSDSRHKLARLAIPEDLTSLRVLDIGCNEGFFCNEAAARGASEVVGIDVDAAALELARELYEHSNITFLHQHWLPLPPGPFDLVLWTSAMHYEPDAAAVMREVAGVLRPDGLFILECGVFDWPTKEMVLVARHSDSRWYPTWLLLEEMLSDFAVRRVAQPEITEGDPVPRSVFHSTLRRPAVMLVRGETGAGKTSLARSIGAGATKLVSLDDFVTRVALASFHHTATQQFIRDTYDPNDLGKVYNGIDAQGLTTEYAKMLADAVAPSDRLVVIEGLLTDAQAEALTSELRSKAVAWDVQRRR